MNLWLGLAGAWLGQNSVLLTQFLWVEPITEKQTSIDWFARGLGSLARIV